jgi:hypothetical protein
LFSQGGDHAKIQNLILAYDILNIESTFWVLILKQPLKKALFLSGIFKTDQIMIKQGFDP